MNLYGSHMENGIHYDKVCNPVVSWLTITILLDLVALNRWKTKQIDNVQNLTQESAEKCMYIKVTDGFKI